jgi:hypothetical protein
VATVAALRALDQTAQKVKQRHSHLSATAVPAAAAAADSDSDVDERYVILDLEPNRDGAGPGLKVKSITSLSPTWAVTSATLRAAPSFEEKPEDADAEALMVLLEGVELREAERPSHAHGSSTRRDEAERKAGDLLLEARKRGGGGVPQGMEEMLRALQQGVAALDKSVGEPEAKDCAMP